MAYHKTRRKHPRQDARWHAIDALLQPHLPATNIIKLAKKRGIRLTRAAVYNWRLNGVSEACTAFFAELTGLSEDEVLRVSGKL